MWWTWACSVCRNGRQREVSCPAWVLCLHMDRAFTRMAGAVPAGPSRWQEGSCYIAFDLSIIFVRDLLLLIYSGSLYCDKSRKVHTPPFCCSTDSRKCVPCDQVLTVREESRSQRERAWSFAAHCHGSAAPPESWVLYVSGVLLYKVIF